MSNDLDEQYAANLALYEALVATNPKVDRKGKTMPYTSLNGHMFSMLTKEGQLALRLAVFSMHSFLTLTFLSLMVARYGCQYASSLSTQRGRSRA